MRLAAALALLAVAAPVDARRQVIVSAEDGKPVRPGDTAADAVPDALAVLEWTDRGLRRIGRVAVPASMTGPPEAVKMTPDGRLAIVTAAQAPGPPGGPPLVPGDALSVVDLTDPARPRLVQSLTTGAGAGGVAIDRAGRMVLVANGGADSVSAFRIVRGRLVPVGTVALPMGSRPVAIRFAHDGRSALVSAAGAKRLIRLSVTGDRVTDAGQALALDTGPGSLALSPDGRFLYVAAGARLLTVDVAPLAVVGETALGRSPEGIALSPDGRRLAAVLLDGSQLAPGAPGYRANGTLRLYRVEGATVTPLGEAPTPPLCQGAAWRRDGRAIALQCAGSRTVELYRFGGDRPVRDAAAAIATAGRGGSMAGGVTR